eukprot:4850500-Pleurochrysis_carterae.AAC.3
MTESARERVRKCLRERTRARVRKCVLASVHARVRVRKCTSAHANAFLDATHADARACLHVRTELAVSLVLSCTCAVRFPNLRLSATLTHFRPPLLSL